jgi:hypothetical protein
MIIVSCMIIVGLIYVGSLLPERTPRSGVPVLVAIGYRLYAGYAFEPAIAHRKSEGWLQYSWCHTLGLSLLFLVAILVIAVVAVSGLKLS